MNWMLALEVILAIVTVVAAFVFLSDLVVFAAEAVTNGSLERAVHDNGGMIGSAGTLLVAASTAFVSSRHRDRRQPDHSRVFGVLRRWWR